MKILIRLSFVALALGFANNSQSQTVSGSTLAEKLSSRSYVFHARTANPARGRTINLTSEYTVKVFGDSLVADLPYYGRAYSAPIGTPGGINFTSTNYNYSVTQGKKNRWIVSIDPKDVMDTQEFSFTVYDNGEADLIVTSNNRQAITFRGHITGR